MTVTLRDNGTGFSSGADGSDTLVNIENLFGGEFDDTLTGNRLANSFLGRGGNDKIDGGGGFDTVNYFAPRSNYTITKVSPGTYTVTDITGRMGLTPSPTSSACCSGSVTLSSSSGNHAHGSDGLPDHCGGRCSVPAR